MTSFDTLAVAAPLVHTEGPATTPQPVFIPTAAHYVGGVAIAAFLTVMVLSGLSVAGSRQSRGTAKSAHADQPHTAH